MFSLSCFIVLEVLFLLALLSNYPGFCSVDSNDIVNQALGISQYQNHFRYDGLSNHHPIFYTFIFWLIWIMSGSTSDPTFAVFLFLLVQSTFVSACIAWALGWFNKRCSSCALVILVSAASILSPVLLVHAVTMWKDVPFAVTFLVLVLKLFDYSTKTVWERKDYIGLFLLCLAISLLRNNGIYISILLFLYMIFVFKDLRKKLIGMLVTLILTMGFIQGPIFNACSISQGHFSESVSVPLQQIAAVAADDAGIITKEQEEFLNNIRPLSEIAEAYNPIGTNPVKFSPSFSDAYLESHKVEFMKTWAEIVIANPGIAVRSWIDLTCGYWQPGYSADIGSRVTIFGEQPTSTVGLTFNPYVYFSALNTELSWLFSMGNVIWLVVAALCILILRNKRNGIAKRMTCFVPMLALELTLLIAAPIVSDFRYLLGLYLLIPFLFILGDLFGLGGKQESMRS